MPIDEYYYFKKVLLQFYNNLMNLYSMTDIMHNENYFDKKLANVVLF